jgi:hypothetical protein
MMTDSGTIQAVKCAICGGIHAVHGGDFVTLHGGIAHSRSGDLLGSCMPEDESVTRYCPRCFVQRLAKLCGIEFAMQRS